MFWDVFCKECDKLNKKPNKIASELGLSSATTTKWKTGAVPNGETLVKIADYFNCSIDYLLGRTEESALIIHGHVNGDNSFQNIQGSPVTNYQTAPDLKLQDGMTSDFLKAFETLDWADKLDIMQLTREKMKKGA